MEAIKREVKERCPFCKSEVDLNEVDYCPNCEAHLIEPRLSNKGEVNLLAVIGLAYLVIIGLVVLVLF